MNKNFKLKKLIILSLSLLIIAASLVFFLNSAKKTNTTLDNSTDTSSENTDNTNSEVISHEENRFENIKLTNEDVGVPILYYH